jgi:hypothetical protein
LSSKTFQRFAIRTEKSLQEMNKKGEAPALPCRTPTDHRRRRHRS